MSARPNKATNPIVRFFCALELTIVCLCFGMVLILVGTLAQVDLGIHQVQAEFFHSWIGWWTPLVWGIRPVIPIPGGYLVGGLLLLNLIAVFIYRFEFTWRKGGLLLSHFGIIVFLLGELFTGLFQEDSHMRLTEGQTKAYAESNRTSELAIIEHTHDLGKDRVLAVHEGELRAGLSVQRPELPFRVEVLGYFANSRVTKRGPQAGALGVPLATQGEGLEYTAREVPRTGKMDERDLPAAWVELFGSEGSLGTWMVYLAFHPQVVSYANRSFTLELRPRRTYLGIAKDRSPYTLSLLDFSHDRYPGTEIARNFSSKVRLVDPRRSEDREVLIYMNHPLRYGGLTFYQSGYEGETTTVLQVVKNPSRHFPYVACALVFLGLGIHFTVSLIRFLGRRKPAP